MPSFPTHQYTEQGSFKIYFYFNGENLTYALYTTTWYIYTFIKCWRTVYTQISQADMKYDSNTRQVMITDILQNKGTCNTSP